jgi:hypothetical protein
LEHIENNTRAAEKIFAAARLPENLAIAIVHEPIDDNNDDEQQSALAY